MNLLGIDIGTSTVKAVAFDEAGRFVRMAEREYRTEGAGDGQYETNAECVWEAAQRVIFEVAAGLPVAAISATSFGEAAIPVDAKGNALYNNILYTDGRGQPMLTAMQKNIDDETLYRVTGAAPHGMYSIYKILWLKENMPDVYRRTATFQQFADFILMKLGAAPHMDYSLGARTQAMDVTGLRWSDAVLSAAEVDGEKFPPLVQAGTPVGRINPAVARRLKLPEGALLVAGGHDQPCAALGAGVLGNGCAADGMGTVECIVPVFDRPLIGEAMRESNLACVPHVLAGRYVTYAFNLCAGALFRWYKETLCDLRNIQRSGSAYAALIDGMADDSQGLMLLPHFAGAATPYMDPAARGAMFGLTLKHKKPHILRALLEGITFEMMINLECLNRAGFHIERLTAMGGMSRTPRLLAMKADMMGLKIEQVRLEQAGAKGAALLAGAAAGLLDAEAAATATREVAMVFEPNAERHAQYQEKMQVYSKLYALAAQARGG